MQQVGHETRLARPVKPGRRPATRRLKRRRLTSPRRGKHVRSQLRWIAASLLSLAAGAALILNAASVAQALRAVPGHFDEVAIAAGLGIDEVSVAGHRFTADSDIFDALDLANVRTMAALNSRAVQARIERLPWVATATISRVFPGRIDVAVTERSPSAVWLNGTGATLVDDTGRLLSAVPPAHAPSLLRLSGEGAPAAAKALLATLAHYPDINARLERATRVTGRRWSLDLTDGLRLELPPEGEATALAALMGDPSSRALLETKNTIVDLRSRREIATRPAGAS